MKKYPIYRPHSWLDVRTKTEKFGIQAKVSATSKWLHVAEDGEACIYDTAEERDTRMEAMRQHYRIGCDEAVGGADVTRVYLFDLRTGNSHPLMA